MENINRLFFLVLSEDQKEKISVAGIEYCDMNIDGDDGIVVDQENLEHLLQVLGLEVSTETETSFEGIVKVDLVAGGSDQPIETEPVGKVTIGRWDGNQKDAFQEITKEVLLPVARKDIYLSVPHGDTRPVYNDGVFYINIWSGVDEKKSSNPKEAPGLLWGINVACRDSGFLPSGQGVPIVDPETGWCVAELVGDNLFIHHDICHHGYESELKLYRKLLEEVVVELALDPEEKRERQRKLAQERAKRSRTQYISECSRRFEKTLKGTKEKIEKGLKEIEALQKQLTRKIRETRGAEKKLKQLQNVKDGQLEEYGQEFDSLMTVHGVEDVQVSDGVIKVFTEHIYITPENHDKTYDIGKFRMEIYTSGANGGIRFFNLTRNPRSDGYNTHHPHVSDGGNACLGNISELVSQLIGEFEYSALAQLGLEFLRSVNTDDSAGRGIFKYWPVVEKKEA